MLVVYERHRLPASLKYHFQSDGLPVDVNSIQRLSVDICLPFFFTFWFINPPCPIEMELARFPNHKAALAIYQFNTNYNQGLLDRQLFQPGLWSEYQEAIQYNQRSNCCWNMLEMATNQQVSLHWRQYYLEELRKKIGEENYWNGVMPDPIPMWTLRR